MSGTTSSNVSNVQIGVCRVTYGGVDLGLTQGGVDVTVKTTTHAVNVDQFGKTAISERIIGRDIKVKVPMAETTLENMVSIMPGATLITDPTTPSKMVVDVPHGIGTDLRSIAKALVLHPAERPDTDASMDLTIPIAATAGDINFMYQLEKERVFNCEFTGYPDNANGKLFQYGDTSTTGA